MGSESSRPKVPTIEDYPRAGVMLGMETSRSSDTLLSVGVLPYAHFLSERDEGARGDVISPRIEDVASGGARGIVTPSGRDTVGGISPRSVSEVLEAYRAKSSKS